jgi:hypothetical protein
MRNILQFIRNFAINNQFTVKEHKHEPDRHSSLFSFTSRAPSLRFLFLILRKLVEDIVGFYNRTPYETFPPPPAGDTDIRPLTCNFFGIFLLDQTGCTVAQRLRYPPSLSALLTSYHQRHRLIDTFQGLFQIKVLLFFPGEDFK